MGSSSSKAAAKSASAATARKYPTHPPPTSTNAQPRPAPKAKARPHVHPRPTAAISRDHNINTDASDAALAARLQSLGPVIPNPTQSNSSTFNTPSSPNFQPSSSSPSQSIFPSPATNPAVSLLTARYRLAEEAEKEFESIGRRGAQGRSFLDVVTLRQVLVLRGRGVQEAEIEKRLELREGTVGRLGVGVVSVGE